MSEKPHFLVDQDFLRAHFAEKNRPPRALASYQGPLVEQILVDAAVTSGEPADLVWANVDFVDRVIEEGAYLPGEYPIEALWSYSVYSYVEEVLRGGHLSFIEATGRSAAGNERNLTIPSCASGLKAFGGERNFDVFTSLNDAVETVRRRIADAQGNQPLIDKIMQWADIQFREADENFHALNKANPIRDLNGAWLRGLPNLRAVETARLDSELEALIARNPLRAARLEEHRRVQDQRDAANPMLRAMKELCRLAKRSFAGVTAGTAAMTPEAPGTGTRQHSAMLWGVRTDRGVCHVYFFDRGTLFKRFQAALHDQGNAQPIATLALSKADFAAIVPESLRRRS